MRLVGTTKSTIEAIRERTHWNTPNLQPMDPVTLGLCSQIDLDFEVQRAAKDRPQVETEAGATLLPAEVTTARSEEYEVPPEADKKKKDDDDVKAVWAKLQQIGSKEQEDESEADDAPEEAHEETAADPEGEEAAVYEDIDAGPEAGAEAGHEDPDGDGDRHGHEEAHRGDGEEAGEDGRHGHPDHAHPKE
jgi:hypothetical protein